MMSKNTVSAAAAIHAAWAPMWDSFGSSSSSPCIINVSSLAQFDPWPGTPSHLQPLIAELKPKRS